MVLVYKERLLESVEINREPLPEIHRSCKQKLISLREIQIAEMEIIRSVQSRYFGKEIALPRKQKELDVYNRIFELDPCIDAQEVLRVGGRIQKSLVHEEIQDPMLLPKGCRITSLIVSWCHNKFSHAGRGITTNQVRMVGFWVIGVNIVVRSMISKFVR